jgi:hypothetical protein
MWRVAWQLGAESSEWFLQKLTMGMPMRRASDGLEKFIRRVRLSQKNVLWPDTLVNSRLVDALLWRGSRDASLVQRIGILLFGLVYFGGGLVVLFFAWEERSMFLAVFSVFWILLGIKVIANGLRCRNGRAGH